MNKALYKFIRVAFSILLILLVVYATIEVSGIGYDFGYRAFTEPAMEEEPGRDVMVQIKDGMTDAEVAEMLLNKGLIRNDMLFRVQLKLYEYSGEMQPGLYTLNTSMTPTELMVALSTVEEENTEDTQAVETVVPDTQEVVTTGDEGDEDEPEDNVTAE